jgi:hypothetical protein
LKTQAFWGPSARTSRADEAARTRSRPAKSGHAVGARRGSKINLR